MLSQRSPQRPHRRICAADRAVGALVKILNGHASLWVGLTILFMPILALAGGLGFQLVGFLIGVSAAVALITDRFASNYLRAAWPIWLLAMVLWAWVSTLWSPYDAPFWGGNASILFGLVIALLFVPVTFLRLPARQKSALTLTVISAGLLGATLLLIDAASGYALSLWGDPALPGEDPRQRLSDAEMNLGRGQVSYAQLLWPVAGLLIVRFRRGWIMALAAFLALMLSAQLNSLSIVIPTLIVAGVVALIAWQRPKFGVSMAFALAIASIALAPILGFISSFMDVDLMRKMPLSWEHRLRMWTYSWELIQQAPLIGHGFDSARVFDELTFRAPDGRNITVMSMHPHNIGLQIWLETGLAGVALSIGMLLSLMKVALKTCTGSARAFAASGLVVTIATSGAVTVGVWQHWWWALIVLAVSLVCLVPEKHAKVDEQDMSVI